jgi:hypothetical protein
MNSVVGWLALVGGSLVAWVRVMTLWTAALLAGAIVLDTLLARRVRAAWRVALYAPIALRVLLSQRRRPTPATNQRRGTGSVIPGGPACVSRWTAPCRFSTAWM